MKAVGSEYNGQLHVLCCPRVREAKPTFGIHLPLHAKQLPPLHWARCYMKLLSTCLGYSEQAVLLSGGALSLP